ncbi:MAG: Iron permease [Actinomycetia bacterium]|nr:Iron permease [Actinomycetes bacterium]
MWDDAFPSSLIGLREGLEAGLIVSILVATLVRFDARKRLPQVWTGVLAAVAVALGFGAVLTFTAANLGGQAQEVFAGTLSVIAVAFVTAMIFWMRRSARTLLGDIREKVTAALGLGAGMLVATSFLAVAREGLETALFLWTTVRAAGESTGPLIGATAGMLVAAGLCWGLYRRVLHINLTRFFTVTGAVLVVIAAGVFGYGLRDLQEGGALPGGMAFDLSRHIDPGTWYATLVQGTLNLTPAMTWLQVAGYLSYLIIVMTVFLRGVRTPAKTQAAAVTAVTGKTAVTAVTGKTAETVAASANAVDNAEGSGVLATGEFAVTSAEPRPGQAGGPGEFAQPGEVGGPSAGGQAGLTGRTVGKGARRWLVPVGVVAIPVAVAAVVIAVSDSKPAERGAVSVSATDCGKGVTAVRSGRQVFPMHNTGSKTAEVYLIDVYSNAVFGEVEGLAPGTTRDLVATLGGGSYAFRCVPAGVAAVTSAAFRVTGGGAVPGVLPVGEADLAAPLSAYKTYVGMGLATLSGQVGRLKADLDAGDLTAARRDWLTAHLGYSSLGAAYGTFKDFDKKINGRADGLPGGVHDKDFTGFHRMEYGLWHGESAASLAGPAGQLVADVAGLAKDFPAQDFAAGDLALRTHEILENTLQFELTGATDQGSGSNLATAEANVQGTRVLLDLLRPLIVKRGPQLLAIVDQWLQRTEQFLQAHLQSPVEQLSRTDRQKINGTLGQLLEKLAPIPDLLEIRKAA